MRASDAWLTGKISRRTMLCRWQLGFWVALLVGLWGCDNKSAQYQAVTPVPFVDGEECHVCGMIITGFPGPKGQAVSTDQQTVAKFCSTRDLFSWWLQPENQSRAFQAFVHDMGRSDWQHPDDRHLIDARTAVYVIGSGMKGAMGPTLAAFKTREQAESFVRDRGGRIVLFEQIDLALLSQLAGSP